MEKTKRCAKPRALRTVVRPLMLCTTAGCLWLSGCERNDEASAKARGLANPTDAPAATAQAERPGWAPEPERSVAAQACLAFIAAQRFDEAVETCGQALEEGHSPEIETALADAKAITGDSLED